MSGPSDNAVWALGLVNDMAALGIIEDSQRATFFDAAFNAVNASEACQPIIPELPRVTVEIVRLDPEIWGEGINDIEGDRP